jgi:hypothetical protein
MKQTLATSHAVEDNLLRVVHFVVMYPNSCSENRNRANWLDGMYVRGLEDVAPEGA